MILLNNTNNLISYQMVHSILNKRRSIMQEWKREARTQTTTQITSQPIISLVLKSNKINNNSHNSNNFLKMIFKIAYFNLCNLISKTSNTINLMISLKHLCKDSILSKVWENTMHQIKTIWLVKGSKGRFVKVKQSMTIPANTSKRIKT